MKTFAVTITGKTPLLMHNDNLDWADFMEEWKNDPDNKKSGKAGDDRSPAWRWLGCCYHDGKVLGIPSANIMRCMMEGGAMVPTGAGKKTFKSQTQSGMMCGEAIWPIEVDGALISWADIEKLKDVQKFTDHKKSVPSLGFDLLVKRAKIGQSKHVRVRPYFQQWTARGTFVVWDEQLDERALKRILECAGQYKGLCDWRPGSPTPGPYGTFEATLKD